MTTSFELSDTFPANPQAVYDAWLDGDSHTEMTGGEATGEPTVGSEFTAWDGYIEGQNLTLEPAKRIVQSWRTSSFSESDEDSQIEVILEPADDGATLVTLKHTNVPENLADGFREGWVDHYFEPMTEYFGG